MSSTLFRPSLSRRWFLLALSFPDGSLAQFTTVRIPSPTHTGHFSFNFTSPTSRPFGIGAGFGPGQFGEKFELFFKAQRRLSALVSVLIVVSITLFCLLLSLLTFFLCNRRRARRELQENRVKSGDAVDQQRWSMVKEFQVNNNNRPQTAEDAPRRRGSVQKGKRLRRSQGETWQMRLRRFIRGDRSRTSLLPLSTGSGRGRGDTESLGSPRSDRGTAASEPDAESSFSTHGTVCTKSQANSVQLSLSGEPISPKRASTISEDFVPALASAPTFTEESLDIPRRRIGMRIMSMHEIIARSSTTSSISSAADPRHRPSGSDPRLEINTVNMSPTIPQFSDLGPPVGTLFRTSISTTSGYAPTMGGVISPTNTKEEWYIFKRATLRRPPPLVLKQEQKETIPTRQASSAAFRPLSVRPVEGTSSAIRTQEGLEESAKTDSRLQTSYTRRSFTNLSSLLSPSASIQRQNTRNDLVNFSSAIVDLESAFSPRT